jgi:hypothetical protein
MINVCMAERQSSCIISNDRFMQYGESDGFYLDVLITGLSHHVFIYSVTWKKNSISFESGSPRQKFLVYTNKQILRSPDLFFQILS